VSSVQLFQLRTVLWRAPGSIQAMREADQQDLGEVSVEFYRALSSLLFPQDVVRVHQGGKRNRRHRFRPIHDGAN
jgi:hypothetical protein